MRDTGRENQMSEGPGSGDSRNGGRPLQTIGGRAGTVQGGPPIAGNGAHSTEQGRAVGMCVGSDAALSGKRPGGRILIGRLANGLVADVVALYRLRGSALEGTGHHDQLPHIF